MPNLPSTDDLSIIVKAIMDETSLKDIEKKISKVQQNVSKNITKATVKDFGVDEKGRAYDVTYILNAQNEVISSTRDYASALKRLSKEKEQASNATKKLEADEKKEAQTKQLLIEKTTLLNNRFDSFSNKLLSAKNSGKITEQQFDELSNSLSQIRTNFNNSGKGIENFNKASFESTDGLQKLNNKLGQYVAEGNEASNTTKELGKNIMKFTEWYLIAGVVTSLIRKFKEMFKQVKLLDDALIELKKVTDLSGDYLDDYTQKAFKLGKQLKTTGVEVINASTEFARAGYSAQEALDLSEVAIKLTNVADGITDTGQSANVLISVLKGAGIQFKDFNDELAMANNLLDQLNAISNNNAVSFDSLADMVQSVSATMATLQNNTKQTLALLTGAYEVLQDTRVAKGISVIGLRIAGLTEETGEFSEELQSTVGKALEQYANIKVFDEQRGQLRSTYDILEELAGKWNTLTKNAQAYLTTTLAGKNRADVLNAIMQNWQGVESAMEDATNSMGSADKEMQAYYDSIEAHIQSFNNAFQEMSTNFIESDFVKGIIDIGSFIIKLIDDLGGLHIVLGEILAIVLAFKLNDIINLFQKSIIPTIKTLITNFNVFRGKIVDVTGQVQNMTSAVTMAQVAIGALTAIISASILIYNKIKQAEEERARQIQENYENAIENYEREIDKLEDLEDSYLRLYNKNSKTASQKEELIKLTKELAKANGLEYESIQKNNEGYLESNELYKELNKKKLKELKKKYADELGAYEKAINATNINIGDFGLDVAITWGTTDLEKIGIERDLFSEDFWEKYYDKIGFFSTAEHGQVLSQFGGTQKEYLELLEAIQQEMINQDLTNVNKGKTYDKLTSKIQNLRKEIEENQEVIDEYSETANLIKFYEVALDDVSILQTKLNEFNNMTLQEQADSFGKIAEEIKNLKDKYKDLDDSSKIIDGITNQFNEQVELLKQEDFLLDEMQDRLSALKKLKQARDEELEQQEKLLKIEEARAKLAEAMNKKVRVYRQGQGFVYETDYSQVQDAQEDLAKAIRDAELDDLSQAIKNLTKAIEVYNKVQLEGGTIETDEGTKSLREYFMSSANREVFFDPNKSFEQKIKDLQNFAPNVDWNKYFSNELDDSIIGGWTGNISDTNTNFGASNGVSTNKPVTNVSSSSTNLGKTLLGGFNKHPTNYLQKEILKSNSIVQNIGNISLPNVTNTNEFITELTKIGNPSMIRK